MPFNVDTATVSLYLHEEAEVHARDEHQQKLLYALFCFALKRPLSRRLANQVIENDIRLIEKPAPHNAPWVEGALNRGETIYQFEPDNRLSAEISHVADWIVAAVNNNEPWLQDRDPRGAPRKLIKFGTIEQALLEADKAMLRSTSKLAVDLGPEHMKPVMTFPDGARVLQLLTPQALDAESAAMRHCVGLGAYDQRLQSGSARYFSLRSISGKPCATMEVRAVDNALVQSRGRQNEPPAPKYTPYLRDFAEQQGLRLTEPPALTGIAETKGRYYDIHNLPENLRYEGHLDICASAVRKLPDGLHVTGDLDISASAVRSLPQRLRVDGNLYADKCGISSIPDDMRVGGNIDLASTDIRSLPPGFRPNRSLNLSDTPLTRLPENFTVPESLDLINTPLAELPRGLNVGSLDLFQAVNLRSVPADIKVTGDLVLARSGITSLPDNLVIGKNLSVMDTRLEQLPRGLVIGASLNIEHTPIRELPPDVKIGHSLYAEQRHLRGLPEGFTLPGSLHISGTTFDTLPRVITIGGNIIIDEETRLPHLPPSFTGKLQRSMTWNTPQAPTEYPMKPQQPARTAPQRDTPDYEP